MSIINAAGIRKEYGTLVALDDIDFQIERGQVVGLVGPNGAGKTTLLKILATLLRPSRGTVKVFDFDMDKDYLDIRNRMGYLPDFFSLYDDLTLKECLWFFAKSYGVSTDIIDEKINTVLHYVNLEDKAANLIRHLSRGMVQRMGLATLLVRDPDIYLLDEPASGLDPKARIQLRDILKQLSSDGKTVIISSHILTELSGFCSHILIMNKGKIVRYGSVEQIRDDMSGAKTVTISVLGQSQKAADLIENTELPVTITDITDAEIVVKVKGGPGEIAAINELLVQNQIKVYSINEEKMDIEDLFMIISSGQEEQASV